MQATHCPVCFSLLETREVAPCHECGGEERELVDLAEGVHTYAEYRIFGLPLIHCNFCHVDFCSHHPSFFGPQDHYRRLFHDLEFVRVVDPATQARYDKYCPTCLHRLTFLQFLVAARAKHGADA